VKLVGQSGPTDRAHEHLKSWTMNNVKQAVPFFMVTDITTSIDFYVKGLGFEIKNSWSPDGRIRWCWLEIGEAALMLQEFSTERHLNTSKGQLGEGVEIFFICKDSLKIYSKIKERGLFPAEPFVGNNMWVVGLRDPDGYKISFESATDVAEETTYSDWIIGQ
jgi:lactoylglutathione lyase